MTVYTGFDDVAYSPCGIPYVHGKEIDNFERLFLASKQAYVDAGIDIHYNADVTAVDVGRKVVEVAGEGDVSLGHASCSPPGSTTRTPVSPAATSGASTTSRTSARPSSGTRSSTRSSRRSWSRALRSGWRW